MIRLQYSDVAREIALASSPSELDAARQRANAYYSMPPVESTAARIRLLRDALKVHLKQEK